MYTGVRTLQLNRIQDVAKATYVLGIQSQKRI